MVKEPLTVRLRNVAKTCPHGGLLEEAADALVEIVALCVVQQDQIKRLVG